VIFEDESHGRGSLPSSKLENWLPYSGREQLRGNWNNRTIEFTCTRDRVGTTEVCVI
jgi:hypothetical protein